jgi:hypothetical protein
MNKIIQTSSLMVLLMLAVLSGHAQRVYYAEPDNDDGRQMSFEIVGKFGSNYLVYKNIRFRNYISVYDEQMKQKDKVNLEFMPENQKIIHTDFIAYADHSQMFYQYQRRNTVYCYTAQLDGSGHIVGAAVLLDTTQLRGSYDNKIYSMVVSEDKKRIMLFKINHRNKQKYVLSTMLYDQDMQLLKRSVCYIPMDEKIAFTDFHLSNEGEFFFGKCYQQTSRDFVYKVELVSKAPLSDELKYIDLEIKGNTLDEVVMKVDNINRQLIITSLYYKQKRGNIEGLYIQTWDINEAQTRVRTSFAFSDELREQARGDNSMRTAFNDFFIRRIIPKKDGGFIITSENYYTQNRGNNFNRYDWMWGNPYLYNSSIYPDYYYWNNFNSPWSSYYYGDRSRFGNVVRYNSDNIAIFSFDRTGTVQWTNVIEKSQYGDGSPDLISHQVFITGGEIHFLFNVMERRSQYLLKDQSITADGQLKTNPTWRGLSKDYDLMPQFGKQVSARVMIMPCTYRNSISFAKLEL